jgi:hypothetical protein
MRREGRDMQVGGRGRDMQVEGRGRDMHVGISPQGIGDRRRT